MARPELHPDVLQANGDIRYWRDRIRQLQGQRRWREADSARRSLEDAQGRRVAALRKAKGEGHGE